MDDPALDPAEHRRALTDLARINAVSGSASVLWPPLRRLARQLDRPVRVLDVATGRGDVPIALHRRAVRRGLSFEFTGCDLSSIALQATADAVRAAGVPMQLLPLDAVRDPIPGGFDAVICSLFLHHLDDSDAVAVLRRMREAGPRLILVNDLERGRFNYLAVWLASRVLSGSKVVHADATLSVQGAFTVGEMKAMAQQAGLNGATVRAKFPCRMLLEWWQG